MIRERNLTKPVVIYNIKGGTGKTTISFQLAKILNYTYVANDENTSALKYIDAQGTPDDEKKSVLLPKTLEVIPSVETAIYDFAGEVDPRIFPLIKEDNVMIIPTLTSAPDIQSTIQLLKEVAEIKSKVIVVINRINNNKEFTDAVETIQTLAEQYGYKDLEIDFVCFKDCTYYKTSIVERMSIVEKITTSNNNEFYKKIYKNVITDINCLLDAIEIQANN